MNWEVLGGCVNSHQSQSVVKSRAKLSCGSSRTAALKRTGGGQGVGVELSGGLPGLPPADTVRTLEVTGKGSRFRDRTCDLGNLGDLFLIILASVTNDRRLILKDIQGTPQKSYKLDVEELLSQWFFDLIRFLFCLLAFSSPSPSFLPHILLFLIETFHLIPVGSDSGIETIVAACAG